MVCTFNTLRPREDRRLFPDDVFKCIFLNENVSISINISPKFVSESQVNDFPALFQIMAWRRPGYKPLSEPMMLRLPTHICVTRPQWVKGIPKANSDYSALLISHDHCSPNNSRKTFIARLLWRGMGVFCGFDICRKSYFQSCGTWWNIVFYCTAICRESRV